MKHTKSLIAHVKVGIFDLLVFGAFILLMVSPSRAAIHDLGSFGQTYPIAERDALKEIKERVAQVHWTKIFTKEKTEKAVQNYRPDTPFLPRAQKDNVRLVNMTYTLDVDIPDGKGGILYPKGYTFNPLDYVNFHKTLVIINGDDPDQVTWFTGSDYAGGFDSMLLLTGGSYYDLGKKLKRPVFYATADIVRRFQLGAVPSIVHQKGRYMEVREIVLSKTKKIQKIQKIQKVHK
jgi:conjugal transfer pilus assembly protein TraW